MDPISIVASSIAIVQAADRIGGLLGKLKPLFEAPREITQLIKDVAALRSLIGNLVEAAEETGRSGILPSRKIHTLRSFLDEAEDILRELEQLIELFKKSAQGADSPLKVHRMIWMRKVGKVERLQVRMRELRLSVTVELSTLHRYAVVHCNKSLDQIAIQAGQLLSEHSSTQRFLLQQFPENQKMLSRILENQEITIAEKSSPEDDVEEEVNDQSIRSYSEPSEILRKLRLKIEQKYKCDQWCRCVCHIPYRAGTSMKWAGAIEVKLLGARSLAGKCTLPACKSRSQLKLQISLGFPRWFLGRVLTVAVLFNNLATPQFSFRTTRIRSSSSQIFIYAQTGDIEGIQKLLTAGKASILDVDEENDSSLNFAISNEQWGLCKFLLDLGSDPFLENIYRQSPYLLAWENILRMKDSKESETLRNWFPADLGGDLGNRQMSRLQLMITGQTHSTIQQEMDKLSQADVNYQDLTGDTALMWAIRCARTDLVKILLSNGADPFLANSGGLAAIHIAAMFDHSSIPLLLEFGIDPNTEDQQGGTSLHAAAFQSHFDPSLYMIPFLDAGADINARDKIGRTALYIACCEDYNLSAVEFLIQHGADLDIPDYENQGPINAAIQWKHGADVDSLIRAGAKCNVIDIYGSNILHEVAYFGDIETIQVFLRWHQRLSDLDINLKDCNGCTPLEYAEWRDDISEEWAEAFGELITAIMKTQEVATTENDMDDSEFSGGSEESEDLEVAGDFDIFEDALEEL